MDNQKTPKRKYELKQRAAEMADDAAADHGGGRRAARDGRAGPYDDELRRPAGGRAAPHGLSVLPR